MDKTISADGNSQGHPLPQVLADLKGKLTELLDGFPHDVIVNDFAGQSYTLGGTEPYWYNQALVVTVNSESAAGDLLALDGFSTMENFFNGEIDLEGNLYILPHLRKHFNMNLRSSHLLPRIINANLFQNKGRAKKNVKSHYDIPQEVLDLYLDRKYAAYSCAMFENPGHIVRDELVTIGKGEHDTFDSLEKAQWRKFKDAIDFIAPEPGETVLDVGCGYGGQLHVALESHQFGKIVGWTLSENQVKKGSKLLSEFDSSRYEINEGDYREDHRVFDHITSTGMVSHVGPRGLLPYVREIKKRIRPGGRYIHHAIMQPYLDKPLNHHIGPLLNKTYVWPGFHWFTIGEHLKVLESNGFRIVKCVNLGEHYEKTIAAWYERMMANADTIRELLGEPTFRAWQQYLAGSSGTYNLKAGDVFRVYCEAR